MMQTQYPFPQKIVPAFFLFSFLLGMTCNHGISYAGQTVQTKAQRINSFDQHAYQAFLALPFYLAEECSEDKTSNSYYANSPASIGGTVSDQSLEAEYNRLLQEKRELDNDKSFQKRRKKRKYQNRPYIKELVEKEQKIINRLKEIELIMNAQQYNKK